MTAYLNIFSGDTVAPSSASLNVVGDGTAAPFVSNAMTLVWALNGVNTAYYAADTVIVNVVGGINVTVNLPAPDQVSPGESITFIVQGAGNVTLVYGAQSYGVVSANSSIKVTVADSTSYVATSTAAISGQLTNLSSLAGKGLTSSVDGVGNTKLDTNLGWVRLTGSADNILLDYQSRFVEISLPGTVTLPSLTNLNNGWYVILKNTSSSNVTVITTGDQVIDGRSSPNNYFSLPAGVFCFVTVSGQPNSPAWVTLGGTSTGFSGFGVSTQSYSDGTISISAGTTTYTIDPTNNFTYTTFQSNATLAAPVNVFYPAVDNIYIVRNDLNQSLIVGVAGAPAGSIKFTVLPGQTATIYIDSVNVFPAVTQLGGGATRLIASNGTASEPGLSFFIDTSTGFYSDQPGRVGLAIGGEDAVIFTKNETQFGTLTDPQSIQVYGDTTSANPRYHEVYGNTTFHQGLTAIGGIDGGSI